MTQDLVLRAPAQENPSIFGIIHELLRQHSMSRRRRGPA
jgi:hypothetical protein